ncbi:hypothetical protein [Chryseobacterium potabilaquae]|uniref:Uncharacterized protein n=1 Tax=Chryseobacterium potabilaquae TaxID=2675057 RepID=A0A6N4X7D9_9FLAO|nr:hypothetical protein [Chryseobacterium potabilaquae]CAA7196999.1 hypothetical protein CHRY9293_03057 [Chryseobacterium potabilaquae]
MKEYAALYSALPIVCAFLISSGGNSTPPWEKENVSFPMMNQEIRHSMQEYERQKEMRQWQTTNAFSEVENKKQWSRLKETTTKIQDRLRVVSLAMQAIPVGITISRDADRIKKTQEKIIEEINTANYSIVVALPMQVQFVDDLQMVIRLLTGIIVSYGAINQMEKSERKILLDYALEEVENLDKTSTYILMKIKDIKEKLQWQNILFKYYVNRDKQVVKDIITSIKTL